MFLNRTFLNRTFLNRTFLNRTLINSFLSRLSFIGTVFHARGCVIAALLLVGLARPADSQDWPQILGPNRNGISSAQPSLGSDWPAQLRPVWTAKLGSGYGGAAVVGNQVLVMHRVGNTEQLGAFDLRSGGPLWSTGWPAVYQTRINPDNGPRCVPTVHGGKAICYGAAGDLTCIRIADGELLWSRSLRKQYDADDGYFGAGSSPLVIQDLVIVCLGGKQAGIIAVELATGKTRWTATDYDASYAAPINIEQADRPMALVITRLVTVLLDAATGDVLSEVKFGSRGPTVNAATPIAVGENRFLLTASYGVGTTLLEVNEAGLTEIFRGQDLLSSQYNTPVYVRERLVGINGREDVGLASLRAIDLKQQNVIWEKPDFGTSHLIGIGSQILTLSLGGQLHLLDATADAYKALADTQLPAGTYRALPALSGNRLVVRNTAGPSEGQLMCFELH